MVPRPPWPTLSTPSVYALIADQASRTRSESAYQELLTTMRSALPQRFRATLADLLAVLTSAQELRSTLRDSPSAALQPAVRDVTEQADRLLTDRFVTLAGADRLRDLSRYLRAARLRLERAPERLRQDEQAMAQVHALEDELDRVRLELPEPARATVAVRRIEWMLQELRVSLFAPTLRASIPVSDKRIRRALAELTSGAGSG